MAPARWPRTTEEARKVQEDLMRKVRLKPLRAEPRLVAAVDASYAGGRAFGTACLYSFPGLEFIEDAAASVQCSFPYVPGYLSFRESPAILAALSRLTRRPDLLLVDGHGIAHPRRFGIATHLGVLLGMPAVGCAKSKLVGGSEEPGKRKGSRRPLWVDGARRKVAPGEGEVRGAVLRTRDGVRPVFVSPGHLVDIDSAVDIVLRTTTRYRLPEPIRCAHNVSQRVKKRM
jgi:deoxyribonuclease V